MYLVIDILQLQKFGKDVCDNHIIQNVGDAKRKKDDDEKERMLNEQHRKNYIRLYSIIENCEYDEYKCQCNHKICKFNKKTVKHLEQIYFNVPFLEKDIIKDCGGKWDNDDKKWFVKSTNKKICFLSHKFRWYAQIGENDFLEYIILKNDYILPIYDYNLKCLNNERYKDIYCDICNSCLCECKFSIV